MGGLVARVVGALLSGFLFSQSVEFTQQYLQRLGGAADELGQIVERFETSATQEGLSRQAAIERLRRAEDRFVARQGEDAAQTMTRFEEVARRYRELRASAPLLRPFVAIGDPDWDMIRRVLDDFRPALPVTADGLVLTLTGLAAGWGIGASAAGLGGMRRRRLARRAAASNGRPTGSDLGG